MAGALTPKQQWALRKEYGSLENARDEALDRSAELRDLWNAWWPQRPAFGSPRPLTFLRGAVAPILTLSL